MQARIEYQGGRALEYAAQTGAQLFLRRRPDVLQPISPELAYYLWTRGARAQIVCLPVNHLALATADFNAFRRTLSVCTARLARLSWYVSRAMLLRARSQRALALDHALPAMARRYGRQFMALHHRVVQGSRMAELAVWGRKLMKRGVSS